MLILNVIVIKPCFMCGSGVNLKITLLHLTSNNDFMCLCFFFSFIARNHRRKRRLHEVTIIGLFVRGEEEGKVGKQHRK